jgi:hypothetical protein
MCISYERLGGTRRRNGDGSLARPVIGSRNVFGKVPEVESVNHRDLAASTYNACWEYLEKPDRTADDDRELLTLAFTSRYHWSLASGEEQVIIANWMVSRAAAAVGKAALALDFAQLAYDQAQDADVPDWLIASVHEGLARAFAAAGDTPTRDKWCAAAVELVDRISDDESRELIAEQLASVPRP